MSEWGLWGYVGVVTGLVMMLAMFLLCMVFMYKTPESPTTGRVGSHEQQPDKSPPDTKQAA